MSGPVFCHGCGHRLQVPAGYERRKLRCPECGVICDLPAPAKRPAAEAAPVRAAPSPLPAEEALPPPPRDVQAVARDAVATCDSCGEPVRVVAGQETPTDCPVCGSPVFVRRRQPRPKKKKADARPPTPPPVPQPHADLSPLQPANASDLDDGNPYRVVGGLDRTCPECRSVLPAGATACVRCGFDPRRGTKTERTFERAEREWQAGWPYQRRLTLFIAGEALVLCFGVIGTVGFGLEYLVGFLCSFIPFTALLAFVLGTFDRVKVVRNRRGQSQVTKTWRACFLEMRATTLDLREYEGITNGHTRDVDFTDWMFFVTLIFCGIVPAILWWYFFIHLDKFYVALTKNHGAPTFTLYQGTSQEHMHDMTKSLCELTGLPYQK